MNLTYRFPGADYSVESILHFTGDAQSAFWSTPFFHFFPQVDRERFSALSALQRREYLTDFLRTFAGEQQALLAEKTEKYNARWQEYRPQIVCALEEAFSEKLGGRFENMVGNITFNPISPRYLKSSSFDVFYLNSEKGALGMALHEIIHFVWFDRWHAHFGDAFDEYEQPHLKWLLSEMVVEPVMRDERLKSINPYFEQGCVYPYFYNMIIEGQPILETLYQMYRAMPIHAFMQEAYAYCARYEKAVREHIAQAENA